ncbi:HAD-superfamily hydrolase, subfamily IIB [Synechococcus sp. PCC 7335]|uniref:HAD-IIB family hydrolase n=1 Tax=Synechococcus sp. (strain ATCC 29403 / PCC 7335) TaxID=91464 RepID=UPI00017ECE91|nr:HAD family hydrolase [Synechococcus sp. PCC 7335]EDX83846.1 HAD-superfamily hydrolase, subfamily IIB [Synechococcus sp. PCC 7335]
MAPQALAATYGQHFWQDIRLVATDMDGTLTRAGEFTPALLKAFELLGRHDIDVMIVTGRSAGWVSAIVNYLPVVGAIAENGGLYIDKQSGDSRILSDIPCFSQHRDCLETLFNHLRKRYPDLCPSVDNPYRITDWTFDIDSLTQRDLDWMHATCSAERMDFTYSTVQCHIKVKGQEKAIGLNKALRQEFPEMTATSVVTVGDSPNDASLFDPDHFPYSVGVANVSHYLTVLAHTPTYITTAPEVGGFVELVNQLTKSRSDL